MTRPASDVAREWLDSQDWHGCKITPNCAASLAALIERERLEARIVGLNYMSAVLERHIQKRLMVSTIYRLVIAEIRKSEAQLAASKSATTSAGEPTTPEPGA